MIRGLSPEMQQFIAQQAAARNYSSEEAYLRDAIRALQEEDEDLEAVREAITLWQQGDEGVELADGFAAIRHAVEQEP